MSFRAEEYARLRDQYIQRDPRIMGVALAARSVTFSP
jgi:hypothetical protein